MLSADERAALDAVSIDECLELTRRLVAMDSSADDHEVGVVLHDLLRGEGIESRLEPVPGAGDNVIAQVGDGAGARLLYSAHLDTVPVADATSWSQPPLAGVVRDGRLYGRGSSDCKGGLAGMAMALVGLARAGTMPRGTLTLTAVTGETKGNLGTRHLVDNGFGTDFAIVGEYSEATRIAIAYRGVVWARATIRGRTAHPGRAANGVDAIQVFLDELAPALRALSFDYRPHPLVPDPRLTITMLDAGHAINTVPDRCGASLDIRLVPGQRADEVWRELVSLVDEVAARAETPVDLELLHSLDPFETSARDPYVETLAGCVRELSGEEAHMMGKVGMCDGNVLASRLGIPVVSYGPGNPSAAGVDEYCEVAALGLCLRSYILFALRGCENGSTS